jgi:hypothetical protein
MRPYCEKYLLLPAHDLKSPTPVTELPYFLLLLLMMIIIIIIIIMVCRPCQ